MLGEEREEESSELDTIAFDAGMLIEVFSPAQHFVVGQNTARGGKRRGEAKRLGGRGGGLLGLVDRLGDHIVAVHLSPDYTPRAQLETETERSTEAKENAQRQ